MLSGKGCRIRCAMTFQTIHIHVPTTTAAKTMAKSNFCEDGNEHEILVERFVLFILSGVITVFAPVKCDGESVSESLGL